MLFNSGGDYQNVAVAPIIVMFREIRGLNKIDEPSE